MRSLIRFSYYVRKQMEQSKSRDAMLFAHILDSIFHIEHRMYYAGNGIAACNCHWDL